MNRILFFLLLTGALAACGPQSNAQSQGSSKVYCSTAEGQRLRQQLASLKVGKGYSQPIGVVATIVGGRFIGTPYVAQTLEIPGEEQVVVHLSGLDCTTFVENVLVLSRLIKKNALDSASYVREIENIRYRGGNCQGYASRLNYFSEWILDNSRKGIIEDMTFDFGGFPYEKRLDFMSTHRSSYAQLADPANWKAIQQTENELNALSRAYIPTENVRTAETYMQEGDIIALTTRVEGLDVSHVGIAVRREGRIHLMHASTTSMKVEISALPLQEYLAGRSSVTGIMVCRIKEVQ
ncbi:MAG: DUF1460 domain-containing protein [Bacteroidetes bacterium]|nr:MAG: DUF1460 domain-containing protein [Bacteroidota bacterium]